jgi:cell division protein FtsZ
MSEVKEINAFMEQMGDDIEVIWGVTFDDTLGEKVKVTLLATGSEMSVVPEELREELRQKREQAKVTGKIYVEEGAVSNIDEAAQPKISWETKTVDVMDKMQERFYGTPDEKEPKSTLSFHQLDDDDELLRRLETEPAINRK